MTCSLSLRPVLVCAKHSSGCGGSAIQSYRGKERQSYWILPRELGWRISFHFTMTFLRSQWWSAPPLPPSSHIPTEQPLRHCSLSFFSFVNLSISHFYMDWTEHTIPAPPPTKRSNSHSSSIFASAVYTDLNVSIAHSANV